MKKYLFLAASTLLLAACSEKPGYEITGTVSNADLNSQYVYLYEYGVKDAAPIDSAMVQNGTFSFEGTQEAPVLCTIRFAEQVVKPARVAPGENAPFRATFVLENGKLAIALDSVPTVNGTPENDAHTAFQAELKNLRNGMKQIYEDLKSEDTSIANAAERKYDEIDRKITETVVNYILAHNDKQTAAKNMLDFRYDIDEDQQNQIMGKAGSVFKSVPGIDKMMDHLNVLKTVAVGNKFVDFEMADPKGGMHKLSEYVGNGKNVVLIDFWASWCPPCRKETPHLVELYKQYKNKGFEIVGISLDNDAEAWAKGVKDLGITWPQLSDLKGWQNAGAALYGVNSIPHTVLVDKEGVIVAKNIHGEEIDAKLQEVLTK